MSSYYIETMDVQRRAVARSFGDYAIDMQTRTVDGLIKVFRLMCIWQQRANDRHRLAHMHWHRLDDIGVSAAQAEREAAKSFWIA